MSTIPEKISAFSRTQARRVSLPNLMTRIIAAVAIFCTRGESATSEDVDELVRDGADTAGDAGVALEEYDTILGDLVAIGVLASAHVVGSTFYMDQRARMDVARLGAAAWLEAEVGAAGKRIAADAHALATVARR